MNKDQKVIDAATLLAESLHPDDVRTKAQWDLVKTLRRTLKEEPEIITMDGEYKYRNGEPARVLCVDADGHEPVITLSKLGVLRRHRRSGVYICDLNKSPYDLIPVKKEPREWVLAPISEYGFEVYDVGDLDDLTNPILVREVLE